MTLDTSPEGAAERRAKVAELHALNYTTAEIAARIGITPRSVLRAKVAAGLSRPPVPRFTIEEYCAAQKMLDDGAPYAEVARTLGRSHNTLVRHLPGYPRWSKHQASQAAVMGRALARIERAPDLAMPHRIGAA